MVSNTDILNELMEISPLVAQIGRQNPYTIPTSYFDTLGTVVLARVAAGGNEEQSLLHVAGKTMPNEVPEGYFDSLAASILTKIKSTGEEAVADELKNISPLVAGIAKKNVYQVPAGYFENLHQSIADAAVEKPAAKVISFSRKLLIRYAAAAAVFVMIAWGAVTFITGGSNQKLDQYVQQGLKNYKTEADIDKALAQVNTDDIINYLQNTSNEKDEELISGVVDEKELPDETEYFDEEFMNSLMNELEGQDEQTN